MMCLKSGAPTSKSCRKLMVAVIKMSLTRHVREHFAKIAKVRTKPLSVQNDLGVSEHERKQVRVIQLIGAFRQRGHQRADLDPSKIAYSATGPRPRSSLPQALWCRFDTLFQTGSLFIGKDRVTLAGDCRYTGANL